MNYIHPCRRLRPKFGCLFKVLDFYTPKNCKRNSSNIYILQTSIDGLMYFFYGPSFGWSMCFFAGLDPTKRAPTPFLFHWSLESSLPPKNPAAGPEETNCAITLLRLYSDQYHHFQLDRLGSLGFFGLIRIPHEESVVVMWEVQKHTRKRNMAMENYGKSPVLIGYTFSNGCFPIVR